MSKRNFVDLTESDEDDEVHDEVDDEVDLFKKKKPRTKNEFTNKEIKEVVDRHKRGVGAKILTKMTTEACLEYTTKHHLKHRMKDYAKLRIPFILLSEAEKNEYSKNQQILANKFKLFDYNAFFAIPDETDDIIGLKKIMRELRRDQTFADFAIKIEKI